MTGMRLLTTLAAAALVLAAAAPVGAQRAPVPDRAVPTRGDAAVDATIDRAARAYKGVKRVRATFEQTLTNPLTGSATVQTGELFQDGKRWSARFTNPRGDRYVMNGRTLWIYTPSSAPRQAVRLTLDPQAVEGFDLARLLSTRPRDRFTITAAGAAAIGGRPTRALQLVPKAPGRLTKAVVWVDDRDGTVRQFEVTENTGLVRRVRLADVRFNVPVPAAEFAFTPPPGVRVIDQATLEGRS